MKWIIFSFLALMGISSCSEQPAKRPLANTQLENFLTKEAHVTIGTDTAYYMVLEANRCISCKAASIQQLLATFNHHQLNLVATPDQVEEIKKFVTDWTAINVIQNYNKSKLNGFLFLKNGLAFAVTAGGQVQSVEIMK